MSKKIKKFDKTFDNIFTLNNIFDAWRNFKKGKSNKKDILIFEQNAFSKIYKLYEEIINNKYIHDKYESFIVYDPKKRQIHKATVKDRIIHQLIYDKLYSYFSKFFILDSYSSQVGKGTHSALKRYKRFYFKCSKNNTKTAYVLQCDIKKCFASIDQNILISILKDYIKCSKFMNILKIIIKSRPCGIPLGNLTSQLFINIYMHEFDKYVKFVLKEKYYIRYADDFIIMNCNKKHLLNIIQDISYFLKNRLNLDLHPNKISIKTSSSGVDFLGWINFSDHMVLRVKTKKRVLKKITDKNMTSYMGLLQQGNSKNLQKTIFSLLKEQK